MQLSIDLMYDAIVNKDTSFEGIFFTAVKTTGIFCRPSCTARKPKKENVEFFRTSKEAISKGYRPCKVCNPMEKLNETPDFIKTILNGLSDDPSRKFKDEDLSWQPYPEALKQYGELDYDECFGYTRILG